MVKVPRVNDQSQVSIANQPNIPMNFGTAPGAALQKLGGAIGSLGSAAASGAKKAAAAEADAVAEQNAFIEHQNKMAMITWQSDTELARKKAELDTDFDKVDPDKWNADRAADLDKRAAELRGRLVPTTPKAQMRYDNFIAQNQNRWRGMDTNRYGTMVVRRRVLGAQTTISKTFSTIGADPTQPIVPQLRGAIGTVDGLIGGLRGVNQEQKQSLREHAAREAMARFKGLATEDPDLYGKAQGIMQEWVRRNAPVAGSVKKNRDKSPPPLPKYDGPSGSTGASGPKDVSPSGKGFAEHIQSFEGYSNKAYRDGSQWSIGYGTKAKSPNETITKDEAMRRLQSEISTAGSFVEKVAPDAPDGVKAALTSLTFNAGTGWAQDGLGRAIRAGDYGRAKEIFTEYTKASGQELRGLVRRRNVEATWFDGPSPNREAFERGPQDIQNKNGFLMSRLVDKGRRSHVMNLAPVMKDRMTSFLQAAKAAGHDIKILSGHRSKEHQAKLWNSALKRYGSVSAARKWVAPPGNSRHNQGIAVDLAYGDRGSGMGGKKTPAVAWAHANAKRFGLHFRLGHEDWHIEPLDAGPRQPDGGGGGAPPVMLAAAGGGGGGAAPLPAPMSLGGPPIATDAQADPNSIPMPTDATEQREASRGSDTVVVQNEDGDWVNVAKIVDGKELSDEEAVREYQAGNLPASGEVYETVEEAEAAAQPVAPVPPTPEQAPPGEAPPLPEALERFGDEDMPGGPPALAREPADEGSKPAIAANPEVILANTPPSVENEFMRLLMREMPALARASAKLRQEAADAAWVQSVIKGEQPFDRYDTDQKKKVDEWAAKKAPLHTALMAGKAEAGMAMVEFANRLNYVPKPWATALKSLAASGDVRAHQTALEVSAAMLMRRPNILDGEGMTGMRDDALLYTSLTTGPPLLSGDDAIKRIQLFKTEEWKAKEETRETEARDRARGNNSKGYAGLTQEDLAEALEIDGSILPAWLGGEAGAEMNPRRGDLIINEFRERYERRFIEFGNHEQALDLAAKDMSRVYSVSKISGTPRLMRWPPEGQYPPMPGEKPHAYIANDIKAGVQTFWKQKAEELAAAQKARRPDIDVKPEIHEVDPSKIQLEYVGPGVPRQRDGKYPSYRVFYPDPTTGIPVYIGKWSMGKQDIDAARQTVLDGLKKKRTEALDYKEGGPGIRPPHEYLRQGLEAIMPDGIEAHTKPRTPMTPDQRKRARGGGRRPGTIPGAQ